MNSGVDPAPTAEAGDTATGPAATRPSLGGRRPSSRYPQQSDLPSTLRRGSRKCAQGAGRSRPRATYLLSSRGVTARRSSRGSSLPSRSDSPSRLRTIARGPPLLENRAHLQRLVEEGVQLAVGEELRYSRRRFSAKSMDPAGQQHRGAICVRAVVIYLGREELVLQEVPEKRSLGGESLWGEENVTGAGVRHGELSDGLAGDPERVEQLGFVTKRGNAAPASSSNHSPIRGVEEHASHPYASSPVASPLFGALSEGVSASPQRDRGGDVSDERIEVAGRGSKSQARRTAAPRA